MPYRFVSQEGSIIVTFIYSFDQNDQITFAAKKVRHFTKGLECSLMSLFCDSSFQHLLLIIEYVVTNQVIVFGGFIVGR